MIKKCRRSNRLKLKRQYLKKIAKKTPVTPKKNHDTPRKTPPIRRSQRLKRQRSAESTNDNHSGMITHLPTAGNKDDIDWTENQWITATATRNYLLDDGFLDLIETNSGTITKVKPNYQKTFINTIGSAHRNPKNFVTSLLSQGIKFEARILKIIKDYVGNDNYIDIGGGCNPRSKIKYEETIKAMKMGTAVIAQGVVRNYTNQTFGIPDLLIRSDWLTKILTDKTLHYRPDQVLLKDSEINIAGPEINPRRTKRRKRKRSNDSQGYHYVVVDIKFKTLPLTSDGLHLRNNGHMKAYKGQLLVYNQALGQMQGYTPNSTYILGRGWKYVKSKLNYSGTSPFDVLGKIDYTGKDLSYVGKVEKSLIWIRDVRQNGKDWDLTRVPLIKPELYPNMCNRFDFPYHRLKRQFAEDINDISLIWKCGPKERVKAHENKVYSWTDPKCDSKAMGINGSHTASIVDTILKTNRTKSKDPIDFIQPRWIKHNWNQWKNKGLEFFVDFEMTCSVLEDIKPNPSSDGKSIIFLIGVGHIDPKSKEWIFKDFLADSIDMNEEKVIIQQFIKYINQMAVEYDMNVNDIPLWHWSPAEPSSWNKAVMSHGIFGAGIYNWSDMLKIFHQEPIGVKGALNYSLKTIAKVFHEHGFTSTVWDGGSSCSDGADAALGAHKVDKECKRLGTEFKENPLMKEIVRYNEVDCKVLEEIIDYLRRKHVNDKRSIMTDFA